MLIEKYHPSYYKFNNYEAFYSPAYKFSVSIDFVCKQCVTSIVEQSFNITYYYYYQITIVIIIAIIFIHWPHN